MAIEIDIGGWIAPSSFVSAITTGEDAAGQIEVVRQEIIDRLIANGVRAEVVSQLSDGVLNTYIRLIGEGRDTDVASIEARKVFIDDSDLSGSSQGRFSMLEQAIATGKDVQEAARSVLGENPAGIDTATLIKALAGGKLLGNELIAALQAAANSERAVDTPLSAADNLAMALSVGGGVAATAINEVTGGMSAEQAAAFLSGLQSALAGGALPSDAMIEAAAVAQAAAAQAAAGSGPAAALAAALAAGGAAASQVVAAMTAGMSVDAAASFGAQLAAALAEGKEAQAAAAAAAQAATDTNAALASGNVPLSDAARLVAALSQGGGGLGGGENLAAVVGALAAGMSTRDAAAEGSRQAAAAAAHESATTTTGDPMLLALATGAGAQALSADASFSNALSGALAAGQSLANAQNEARQIVAAIVEQTRATGGESGAGLSSAATAVADATVGATVGAAANTPTVVAEAVKTAQTSTNQNNNPIFQETVNKPDATKTSTTTETKTTTTTSPVATTTPSIVAETTTNNVNHAPVGVADSGTAIEAGGTGNATAGSNAAGNVLTNDTDVDGGDAKTVVSHGSATYGTLTIAADGAYTYVINENAAAVQALRTSADTLTDTISYTVQDKAGLTSTATLTITLQGADDAPVAVADSGTAIEAGGTGNGTAGSSAAGNVLTNDTDVDSGDAKTVVSHGSATYGTVTINADGSYTYTVNNANTAVQALRTSSNTLVDTISYTVQDTAGLTSTATLTITLQGADDAPVAVADTGTAIEAGGTGNATAGSNAAGNVLTNDTDVDSGDAKTVVSHGSATYGTVTINGDGSYTYTVNETNTAVQALRTSADTLTDTISYTVQDTAGLTSTATLTITLQGADDAPVGVADAGTAIEAGGTGNATAGSNAAGNVLTNDTDVDSGDAKTVVSHGSATYGTLTINGDGSYTYTVNETNTAVQALRTSADTLTDTISYTVQDTAGLTSTATLAITITGADDAPVGVADAGTAIEAGGTGNGTAGSNAAGNVLTNDTDVDSGDAKTVVSHGSATYGTLTINADGSYTYVINENAAAVQALRTSADTLTDTISYTVQDTAGLTSTATLTVTLQGADDAPVGVADAGTAIEAGGTGNATAGSGAAGNVLTNDTDVDSGDTKTVSAYAAATYGTVTINADGSYTYIVNNANTDVQALRTSSNTLVDTISYTVQDTAGLTSTATLTITITGADDAPVGVADAGTAIEAGGTGNGTAGSNAAGNVLTNDTDVDSGDTKTVSALAGGTVGVGLAGTYGTLTLSSDGAYAYAVDNSNSTVQALRTSSNTLTDTFTYTVQDAAGLTSTAVLTVTIQGADDAPVGVADTATAAEASGTGNGTAGTNPTGNVLTNDTDVDSGDTKTVSALAGGTVGVGLAGTYGSLTLNSNGAYTYTVNNADATVQALRTSANTLTDAFTYTVQDTAGLTSTATLTVTIQGADDAPVGVADTATAAEAGGTGNGTAGTNPAGNVLTNDTDVDSGDAKTVSAITGGTVGGATAGSYGSLTLNSNGAYTYTVNNANATVQALASSADTITDTFTYTVQDTAGLTSTATLTVTIQGANDAPTASNATINITNTPSSTDTFSDQTGTLSATDVDGNALTAGLTGGTAGSNTISGDAYDYFKTGTYGTLYFNTSDLKYRYVADAAAINALVSSPSESFSFSISDGALSTTSTITVSIASAIFVATDTIAAGQSKGGAIGSVGENDGFAITLTAGTHYVFQLYGDASSGIKHGGGTIPDTRLRLADSNGTTLFDVDDTSAPGFYVWNGSAYVTDGGFTYDSQIKYTPSVSGTYYLGALGFGTNTGTYTLKAFTLPADPPLPPVAEDTSAPLGETIANLFHETDPAQIAVMGNAAPVEAGAWQYSLDAGQNWLTIARDVSDANALLLSPDAMLRFLPTPDWHGIPDDLWVGTSQTALGVSGATMDLTLIGGGEALTIDVVSTSVTAVNDAPIATGSAHLPIAAAVGMTVDTLLAGNFSDAADAARESQPDALAGALVVGNAADATEGEWRYSSDQGQTWSTVLTTASDATAQFISATDLLRFTPEAGFDGATTALTVRLVETGGAATSSGTVVNVSDAGATGGAGQISAATVSVYADALPASHVADDYRAMVLGEAPQAGAAIDETHAAAHAAYDGADVFDTLVTAANLHDHQFDHWAAVNHG
jgi:trimeric autotransporter adhesin